MEILIKDIDDINVVLGSMQNSWGCCRTEREALEKAIMYLESLKNIYKYYIDRKEE